MTKFRLLPVAILLLLGLGVAIAVRGNPTEPVEYRFDSQRAFQDVEI